MDGGDYPSAPTNRHFKRLTLNKKLQRAKAVEAVDPNKPDSTLEYLRAFDAAVDKNKPGSTLQCICGNEVPTRSDGPPRFPASCSEPCFMRSVGGDLHLVRVCKCGKILIRRGTERCYKVTDCHLKFRKAARVTNAMAYPQLRKEYPTLFPDGYRSRRKEAGGNSSTTVLDEDRCFCCWGPLPAFANRYSLAPGFCSAQCAVATYKVWNILDKLPVCSFCSAIIVALEGPGSNRARQDRCHRNLTKCVDEKRDGVRTRPCYVEDFPELREFFPELF